VVLWNKGSELLYGYSQEEALGRKIEDLILPEAMRAEVIEAMNGWLERGSAIAATEVTLPHKDGSPVPIFSSHALSYNHQNEPEIFCVDVNLSDLKEAQTKQTLMAQQLDRTQKMAAIGLMAGGVAHDLNNILSGIISYPERLLMQLPADSSMRKPLEIIKESGFRAAAVVADLLTVARGVAKTTEIANPQQLHQRLSAIRGIQRTRSPPPPYQHSDHSDSRPEKHPLLRCPHHEGPHQPDQQCSRGHQRTRGHHHQQQPGTDCHRLCHVP
jgi:PAS domain S-box-containing protein